MGTLFNQSPRLEREYYELGSINDIKELAEKTNLSFDQVVNALHFLELRRKNDLYVSNGDIHDEQMAGIGLLLQQLIER